MIGCLSLIMKVLLLICYVSYVYARTGRFDSCRTPDGKLGECKVIHSCPYILDLVQVHPIPSATVTFLKRSNCGFQGLDPKVCCNEDNRNDDDDYVEPKPSYDDSSNTMTTNLLPDKATCGVSTQNRIVGGEVTDLDEFPWMVLIDYQKPQGHGFHCGGVLINKRYVLTAAHCVKGKDLPRHWDLYSVRLGEYDTETDTDCVVEHNHRYCSDPTIDIKIEEKMAHELYDPYDVNQHHDIALLRMEEEVTFTNYIKPICLPISKELLNQDYTNLNMTVAGWGKTETKSESKVKLKVQVPVKSKKECAPVYSTRRVSLGNGQLCAGGVQGKDSCRGDSGGPLMAVFYNSNLYSWYVTGVVSFGPSPCGVEGWPGVYTKVVEYVPWILKNIKP